MTEYPKFIAADKVYGTYEKHVPAPYLRKSYNFDKKAEKQKANEKNKKLKAVEEAKAAEETKAAEEAKADEAAKAAERERLKKAAEGEEDSRGFIDCCRE